MNSAEFYKNKPKNLQRIAAERVWSYEVTDHTSGWIYVEYVLGAESGENLCSVLMNAMQERGGADVFHGVPKMLYLDPGSANTASMTKNLCRSLGIDVVPHKPHNARATGQVEKARDIIECKFEPGLKFQPVHMLYHWLFSFAFALVYVLASAYWPKVRLWYGAAYGLIITIAMHGFLIPALGFRHPAYLNGETGWLWNLNGYELWSEILGHICWSFSIEISMIAVLALLAKPIQGAWANRP